MPVALLASYGAPHRQSVAVGRERDASAELVSHPCIGRLEIAYSLCQLTGHVDYVRVSAAATIASLYPVAGVELLVQG